MQTAPAAVGALLILCFACLALAETRENPLAGNQDAFFSTGSNAVLYGAMINDLGYVTAPRCQDVTDRSNGDQSYVARNGSKIWFTSVMQVNYNNTHVIVSYYSDKECQHEVASTKVMPDGCTIEHTYVAHDRTSYCILYGEAQGREAPGYWYNCDCVNTLGKEAQA